MKQLFEYFTNTLLSSLLTIAQIHKLMVFIVVVYKNKQTRWFELRMKKTEIRQIINLDCVQKANLEPIIKSNEMQCVET